MTILNENFSQPREQPRSESQDVCYGLANRVQEMLKGQFPHSSIVDCYRYTFEGGSMASENGAYKNVRCALLEERGPTVYVHKGELLQPRKGFMSNLRGAILSVFDILPNGKFEAQPRKVDDVLAILTCQSAGTGPFSGREHLDAENPYIIIPSRRELVERLELIADVHVNMPPTWKNNKL